MPESVSLLTGAVAWYRIVILEVPRGLGVGIDLWFWAIALGFAAALLSAPAYRLFERPRMRRHFALYMLPLILLAPDFLLFLFLYFLPALILFLTFASLPIIPICVVYEKLYAGRFAESEEETNETPDGDE